MRKIVFMSLALVFAANGQACDVSKEEPIQHLKIADITSAEVAKNTFIKKTSQMIEKKKLDAQELHQIHMITYSLEKSIAYYVENLEGDRQVLAKEIAVVVEDIHIASENNRADQSKQYLDKYFSLAEKFRSGFK